MMKFLVTLILLLQLLDKAVGKLEEVCSESNKTSKSKWILEYNCNELESLMALDNASSQVTEILIYNSNLQNIAGLTFIRFRETLEVLDIHASGIRTIDSTAFVGLTKLNRLILWGNQLTSVEGSWFSDLHNLKELDVSFNSIRIIQQDVFNKLPGLEFFYFDGNELTEIFYHLFPNLYNLKKVKFGKNPWKWWFRALLTRQMQYQGVRHEDEWGDWSWMNNVVWECMDNGEGYLNDTVLDCAVQKFFDVEVQPRRNLGYGRFPHCVKEVFALLSCTKTGSRKEAVRVALQGYTKDLKRMTGWMDKFHI